GRAAQRIPGSLRPRVHSKHPGLRPRSAPGLSGGHSWTRSVNAPMTSSTGSCETRDERRGPTARSPSRCPRPAHAPFSESRQKSSRGKKWRRPCKTRTRAGRDRKGSDVARGRFHWYSRLGGTKQFRAADRRVTEIVQFIVWSNLAGQAAGELLSFPHGEGLSGDKLLQRMRLGSQGSQERCASG